MSNMYVIQRLDSDLYYYGLLPTGHALWCDRLEDAPHITYEEAEDIISLLTLSPTPVKRYDLTIEIINK
jgi:hypothetical protein